MEELNMNQLVLIGKLQQVYPTKIILNVNSMDHEGYDRVPITINENMIEHLRQLELNAYIGIKGRIRTDNFGDIEIVADKITMVSP